MPGGYRVVLAKHIADHDRLALEQWTLERADLGQRPLSVEL